MKGSLRALERILCVCVGALFVVGAIPYSTLAEESRDQFYLDGLELRTEESPVDGEGSRHVQHPGIESRKEVRTVWGAFDPKLEDPPSDLMIADGYASNYVLIQFRDNVGRDVLSRLEESGLRIVSYLPVDTFIAIVDVPGATSSLATYDEIRYFGPLPLGFKLSHELLPALKGEKPFESSEGTFRVSNPDDLVNTGNMDLLVVGSPGYSIPYDKIEEVGGQILQSLGSSDLLVSADASTLVDLAKIEEVRWIEPQMEYTILNDRAAGVLGAQVPWGLGLEGQGQTIAIIDTGLDKGDVGDMHPDLAGRVTLINYKGDSPDDLNGHGTHVAGSIAGNGQMSGGSIRGVAPQADIIMQASGDDWGTSSLFIEDLTSMFQDAHAAGARIHSNSWGVAGSFGTYPLLSYRSDLFMWDNKDFLILYAAGNSGIDSDGDGIVDEGSISPPSTAKNVVTVGASENDRWEMVDIDNDADGSVDEDEIGDMNGDGAPGIAYVDDDGDGDPDFNDVQVREMWEVWAYYNVNRPMFDTDWNLDNIHDILYNNLMGDPLGNPWGYFVPIHDGVNNDWDHFWDHPNSGIGYDRGGGDEKYMDCDDDGLYSIGDTRLDHGGDGVYDANYGDTLWDLIDENLGDRWGGRWSERYWPGLDHNEDTIVGCHPGDSDLTRNYNDDEIRAYLPFALQLGDSPLQSNDDDEDGLVNEDTTDTWGMWNPWYYPADPIASDAFADNPEGLAPFSGRGPTVDGRIKPTVVAPGTLVLSTRTQAEVNDLYPFRSHHYYNDYYLYSSGTSMATPLVAGSAALVRQYYLETRGVPEIPGHSPSAALIKSTLVNGAHDLNGQYGETGPIPNVQEGWGRVDLSNSILDGSGSRVLNFDDNYDGVVDGETVTYTLKLEDASEPLAVSLVWTDYPGSTSCNPCLVNNLDLRIITPGGEVYLGNNMEDGFPVSGGQPDDVNVVEMVRIPDPSPGIYKIIVHAAHIVSLYSPQPYALVLTSGSGVFGEYPLSPPEVSYCYLNDDDDYTLYDQHSRINIEAQDVGGAVTSMRFSNVGKDYDTESIALDSPHGLGWESYWFNYDPFDEFAVYHVVGNNPHPYPPGYQVYYYDVPLPGGTKRAKLVFNLIDLFEGSPKKDRLTLLKEPGSIEIESWEGYFENEWTGKINVDTNAGESLRLRLRTYGDGAYGFYGHSFYTGVEVQQEYPSDSGFVDVRPFGDAHRLKMHFNYVALNEFSDRLMVRDLFGNIDIYDGYTWQHNFWSPSTFFGNTLHFDFGSDDVAEHYGYYVDKFERYTGYPPDFDEWYSVNHPHAETMKIHFSTIQFGEEADGDMLEIFDANGVLVEVISQSHPNGYWTQEIEGDVARIHFITDSDPYTAYGWSIDSYEYYDRVWSDWEPYGPEKKPWNLLWPSEPGAEGPRTLWCQVLDDDGFMTEYTEAVDIDYWNPSIPIPQGSGWGTASGDHLAVQVKGDVVHLVWTEYLLGYSEYRLWYVRGVLDSFGWVTWEDPAMLSGPSSDDIQLDLVVAFDYVHVIWSQSGPPGYFQIYYRRGPVDGSTWTEPPVALSSYWIFLGNVAPSIAASEVGATSYLHVAWQYVGYGPVPEYAQLRYLRGVHQGAAPVNWQFTDAIPVGPAIAGHGSKDPSINSTAENIYLAWLDWDDSSYRTQVFFMMATQMEDPNIPPGWALSSMFPVSPYDPANDAFPPEVKSSASYVHVVWSDTYFETYYRINTDTGDPGSWFPSIHTVSLPRYGVLQGEAYSPAVSIDNGWVYITWFDSRDEFRDVYVAKKAESSTEISDWEKYGRLVRGQYEEILAHSPAICVTDGVIHIVYKSDELGDWGKFYKNDFES